MCRRSHMESAIIQGAGADGERKFCGNGTANRNRLEPTVTEKTRRVVGWREQAQSSCRYMDTGNQNRVDSGGQEYAGLDIAAGRAGTKCRDDTYVQLRRGSGCGAGTKIDNQNGAGRRSTQARCGGSGISSADLARRSARRRRAGGRQTRGGCACGREKSLATMEGNVAPL